MTNTLDAMLLDSIATRRIVNDSSFPRCLPEPKHRPQHAKPSQLSKIVKRIFR